MASADGKSQPRVTVSEMRSRAGTSGGQSAPRVDRRRRTTVPALGICCLSILRPSSGGGVGDRVGKNLNRSTK